jgi:sec-independent protein translocase protein TatB
MFDLAWSEIALIGVVALIAIGPKDMPVAIKAVAQMVKKARRMAGEFQTHVDEMVREANLHEVRDQINEIRSMDIKGKILNAVDDDGSIRRTMADRPFNPSPPPVTPVVHDAPAETVVQPHADHAIAAPDAAPASGAHAEPPPMIPPAYSDPRAAPPVQHEVQREAQHEPAAHPAPHA